MTTDLVIGIDVGTSGVRAVAMDAAERLAGQGACAMDAAGPDPRHPQTWLRAVELALTELLGTISRHAVRALAVDGTSGTTLPVDAAGTPLNAPLMYNDAVPDTAIVERIASIVPAESAANGPTSGLAKALHHQPVRGLKRVLHQADWIMGQFTGRFDTTDENNALKTGYDPIGALWPDWMAATGLDMALLPRVVAAGAPVGRISRLAADRFGLPVDTLVVAGTTDGCASFLATGASALGDGVTALGSTLTLKLLSDRPIFAPAYGIYSHRILGMWLAGGASNSGGKVLGQFFDTNRIRALSAEIDPETDTGLDYYPLLKPGERFPIADPVYPPRLTPRPESDATFLQGMLEGIAAIEALGYRRLAELGAPQLKSMRSVGGGAANAAWTHIRQRRLGVPFLDARSQEAAAGTARLALAGARAAGLLA
ncbi:FGGY-family carbohydrate kinase [Ollibium composti]|uniref:Carbohydrate kinase n=1 Tax=Ollibium composti TaxID=2675109 RepID=A0ABY2Q5W5_9HYPH|nr:FGGY-family carbohydrate kinase [Mesorhizobium composti]THF56383.1 carbohydrate kinase [Mesorhizobium composti]